METQKRSIVVHPLGEQPTVEVRSAIADTFAGRVHVEWDATAPVAPFGQLPFFIDYLKQAGLFDAWVADCPLSLTSPNAPKKRDLLGTVLLSVLAGHRRYAHLANGSSLLGRAGTLNFGSTAPERRYLRMVFRDRPVRREIARIES